MLFKNKRLKSKKITDSARDEDCTIRMPTICNFNCETTVFAHVNGGGMGTKHHDIHGCYACSDCHDWYDKSSANLGYKSYEMLRAMIETQSILLRKGLIKT